MRKGIAAIAIMFCAFLITSCKHKQVVVPPGVLDRQQMTAVLTDIQILEGVVQVRNLSYNDSTKLIAYGYYNAAFQKHHITAQTFRTSFNFYLDHPELLNEIYQDVTYPH